MKKLSKRQTKAVVIVTVFAATLSLATVIFCTHNYIQNIKNSNQNLVKELIELKNKDPRTLDECLNQAALDYSNYVKLHGTNLVDESGKTTYNMPLDQWNVANDKLASDKSNCEVMFGK